MDSLCIASSLPIPAALQDTPRYPRSVPPTGSACRASSGRRGQPVDAIIGRHDRRGIEARGIDQPQPKLAFRPAAAGAGEAGREVALEFLFRETARSGRGCRCWCGRRTSARPRAASPGVPVSDSGMRVADDRVGRERLRAGRAGQGEQRGRERSAAIWAADLAKGVRRDGLEPVLAHRPPRARAPRAAHRPGWSPPPSTSAKMSSLG